MRCTVQGSSLVFDAKKRADGRGAYIINDATAAAKVPKMLGKFLYLLRHTGPLSVDETSLRNALKREPRA